jgi:hypothetical protein
VARPNLDHLKKGVLGKVEPAELSLNATASPHMTILNIKTYYNGVKQ